MKLVRLIEMCLNETYLKAHVSENLSDEFPIQNGLKQGNTLWLLPFNCSLEYVISREWNCYWSRLTMLYSAKK